MALAEATSDRTTHAKTGDIVGAIAEIRRYPVQSMQGESLERAEVRPGGLLGDRIYGIVDPEIDEVVSSAQGKRKWRGIVGLSARFLSPPRADAAPTVEIILSDGERLRSDQPDMEARLSAVLGAPLRFVDKARDRKRSAYSHEPLHILTTATLAALRERHPTGRFMPARFRPNLVIDTAAARGFLEHGWLGRQLAIGNSLRIAITEHCVRCVMTTLPQADLPHDPAVLQTINQHNDTHAGVYASVLAPGEVMLGDAVRLLP